MQDKLKIFKASPYVNHVKFPVVTTYIMPVSYCEKTYCLLSILCNPKMIKLFSLGSFNKKYYAVHIDHLTPKA